MSQQAPDVRLPNAGAGPNPLSLSELAARDQVDAIVLLFQRDHYCANCRQQVQQVNERYAEFTTRDAWVVSVLPEDADTARQWVESYQLKIPVLADEDKVAAEAYGQGTRFGWLGEISDLVGRLPKAVILDTREGELAPRFVHEGEGVADRPSVDELLEQVTEVTGNEGVEPEDYA